MRALFLIFAVMAAILSVLAAIYTLNEVMSWLSVFVALEGLMFVYIARKHA
mgnify:CR=1 FL=1